MHFQNGVLSSRFFNPVQLAEPEECAALAQSFVRQNSTGPQTGRQARKHALWKCVEAVRE